VTVLAVDAGTTTVRCVAVDGDGRPVGEERLSLPPANPAPGLVEFDALVLAEAVMGMATEVLERHGPVDGVGIASQRASAVAWDRSTGQPVGPGIGWQDLRTVARCGELRAEGVPVAPNQSATKFEWLMGESRATGRADLCLGTVDSWLAWVLTCGKAHVTDLTNAAATGLLALDGSWDVALLDCLSIPASSLPEVVGSAGVVTAASVLPGAPPISALAGDQQASLIGLGCVSVGQTKLTAGTGAMVDMCTGDVAGTGADDGVIGQCLAKMRHHLRQIDSAGGIGRRRPAQVTIAQFPAMCCPGQLSRGLQRRQCQRKHRRRHGKSQRRVINPTQFLDARMNMHQLLIRQRHTQASVITRSDLAQAYAQGDHKISLGERVFQLRVHTNADVTDVLCIGVVEYILVTKWRSHRQLPALGKFMQCRARRPAPVAPTGQ